MKVAWRGSAIGDLEHLRRYIGDRNPIAAQEVAAKILDAADRLYEFPLMGRTGRIAETREWVVGGTPYIIAYAIDGNTIRVLAVIHGRLP
jgi:toxin ParE1/3/4